jgi:hypothetical protein
MTRLLCALLVLAEVLLSSQRGEDEQLRFNESLRESVLLPLPAAEKSRLTVIDTVMVMDEDENAVAGILVLYDDIRTKREIDYVEL